MAKMLPPYFDVSTVSTAERRLFDLLRNDPGTKDWVVLHSLGLARRGRKPYGEIDFVLLIPGGGVFCLEVKGGRVACRNGEWEITDRNNRTVKLRRSPFLQAREGMFALRESVEGRTVSGFLQHVVFGYAVVMPDIEFDVESPEWEPWQVIDRKALSLSISSCLGRLSTEQRRLVRVNGTAEPIQSTVGTLQRLLRPDFERVVTRGVQIEDTESRLLQLTEEQFNVLDMLVDNSRCLVEGAAGTGKTLLAVECARRATNEGSSTLLLCFNRLLGGWLEQQAKESKLPGFIAGPFYRLLRDAIMNTSFSSEFIKGETILDASELFGDLYPRLGQMALQELAQPFDVIVVDEAQDLLLPGILDVLNVWLKGGLSEGRWAMFGDFHRQAIFSGTQRAKLIGLISRRCSSFGRGRLVINCRNTQSIGEETSLMSGFSSMPYKLSQVVGQPVDYQYYNSAESQRNSLTAILQKLLVGGVRASDIVVLSRLKLENSGVFGCCGPDFVLSDSEERQCLAGVPMVRFSTIQAFKGLESPVVVLCDVDPLSTDEFQSLLYVGMSRARCELFVLMDERTRPFVLERIRNKLNGEIAK
jgi:hypothetical protein